MLQLIDKVKPVFNLGHICWTVGINATVAEDEHFARFVLNAIARHAKGDWGDIDLEDWQENEYSLERNLRLLSVYKNGKYRIWIITESDRSVTTVLYPNEY
jgi:hypothetical protein